MNCARGSSTRCWPSTRAASSSSWKTGKRLLANLALVDTQTGRQIWSERYDRLLEDLFTVQDKLSLRIATSLRGTLRRDQLDLAQRKRPGSLEAFDLSRLAGQELDKVTPEANANAVELIQRAIELDPAGSYGFEALANAFRQQVDQGWAPRDVAMARWLDAASQAVQLDPTDTWARYLLAQRYLYANEMRRWWAEVQRVAELATRDVTLMSELGAVDLPIGGQTARGVELVERAVRLDPANPEPYH